MSEIKKLKQKNIPVHTLDVDNDPKACFEQIAKETNGNCRYLNVNDEKEGQKLL